MSSFSRTKPLLELLGLVNFGSPTRCVSHAVTEDFLFIFLLWIFYLILKECKNWSKGGFFKIFLIIIFIFKYFYSLLSSLNIFYFAFLGKKNLVTDSFLNFDLYNFFSRLEDAKERCVLGRLTPGTVHYVFY